MEHLLEDKIRYHKLYDIYKELLTEKQRMYFEYSYLDDYSLSEIAEILSVSRNAVHLQLKSVLTHLDHFEKVLKIHTQKQNRTRIIEQLLALTKDTDVVHLIKDLEREE